MASRPTAARFAAPAEQIGGGRARLRVTSLVLGTAMIAYSVLQSLVTPVLPTIQREMHSSQNTVTWVLTVYLLSASVWTPILGRIGDKIGKRRVFVAALAALSIGSLLAAVAPSMGILIIARAIQGIGGGVIPLTFGIIRDEFPPHKVASAVGAAAALTAFGGGLGLVLAGPIVDGLGYHWLFWTPMIVIGLAAAAAYRFVPDSPVRAKGPISVLGGVLLSTWLILLLIAISQGSIWGWTSGRTLGLIGGSLVVALAWYVAEERSPAPLIDMKMMRLPAVWTTNLVSLLFGVGMYATMAVLPEFVQTPRSTGYGFGASISGSGFFMMPLTVAMFICGMLSGRLSDRFGSKDVLLAGAALSAVGYGTMAFAHGTRLDVYIASGVIGIGLGLAFSAMSNLIVIAVRPDQTGVASGMNANIRTIGGSIGAAVTATIITSGLPAGALPHDAGYRNGFAVLAGVSVLATLAVLLIPTRGNIGSVAEQPHAELALVAAGTLAGSEPE